MRREVKPEPVPPPNEWKIRNPCMAKSKIRKPSCDFKPEILQT